MSGDSSFGLATGYELEDWSRFPAEEAEFSFVHGVQPGSGAHPASYLIVKRPGREADRSPWSSAQVKYGGAIPPLLCMSSRHNALLSTGTTLPLPLTY
jgi:hypothetical protein